jgi:hypothetical protein
MRYFNSSGPNVIEQHYTLMRPELVSIGLDYVHKERYFTIWAPRQTGKSTYFQLLTYQLEAEGYKVAHVNCTHFGTIRVEAFLDEFHSQLQRSLGVNISSDSIESTFNKIMSVKNPKLVLIVDGIDNINPVFLGNFLLSIRVAFHSRAEHALKSVILGGVKNILDIVHDTGNSFNIADNFSFPYFTDAETLELIEQHELETGQLFDPSVKKRISQISANQPHLVNGLAALSVKENLNKIWITHDDYFKIENLYAAEAIDKNTLKTVIEPNKSHTLIERLLFTGAKIHFQITREDIKELYFEGIITRDENGFVMFRVPLYQKCLHQAFYPYMNGEVDRIRSSVNLEDYFTEGGAFLMDNVIAKYKEYALRRRFRYFREKDKNGNYYTLKEATLVYSFETYINAFLGIVGGKSYLEAQTGLGRTDLLINVNNQEFVVEAKVYSDITQFKNGKKQLATYAKSLNLDTAIYLVFVEAEVTNKNVVESNEVIDDVSIKTHLVFYNLETDFSTEL